MLFWSVICGSLWRIGRNSPPNGHVCLPRVQLKSSFSVVTGTLRLCAFTKFWKGEEITPLNVKKFGAVGSNKTGKFKYWLATPNTSWFTLFCEIVHVYPATYVKSRCAIVANGK